MDYDQLELTIIAAENLKDVRHVAKMHTYATTWIDSDVKYTTEIDEVGGVNPVWKDKFVFLVPKHDVLRQELKIEIYTDSLTGRKLVGKALIPLLELPKRNAACNLQKNGIQYVNLPIKTSARHVHGRIYVSYRWKESIRMEPERKLVGAASNAAQQGLINVSPYVYAQVVHKNRATSSSCLPQKCVDLRKSYSSKEVGHSLKACMSRASHPPDHNKQLPTPIPPPHATSLHTSFYNI